MWERKYRLTKPRAAFIKGASLKEQGSRELSTTVPHSAGDVKRDHR